ncbi:phosphoribosylamine--glycine ligase [Candidatus Pelagibacter sp.]|uniref:phosphoribosylamine--glycine ligase n=1 Tax=Candidatus Pelagibacter sp. TaxID=2024849 RepID=UPI003F82D8D5
MKVGVIGSGGREHAICYYLSKSKIVDKIFCIPGNAGTEEIAENVHLDINDHKKIKDLIDEKNIDLIVVGPEKPLVEGIVDYLEQLNIKVFGPNKIASQLEGSKSFTKEICKKYKIPTADYGIFQKFEDAINFAQSSSFPLVVKADGLASGKGVYICDDFTEAKNALKEIFEGKFGEAKNVLLEEFLDGEEMSFFIISDGKTFKDFDTAQDHKRVLENDKGKNTGGMGAYSPSRLINQNLRNKIIEKIINPTLMALTDLDCSYKGFLYAGLMIKNDEPFLIEYNVRMGDPECQTILPKLKNDLGEVFLACTNKNLDKIDLNWHEEKSLSIVLCSKGYPDRFKNNVEISNLDKLIIDKKNILFHAGTKKESNKILSNGGRVLNFIALDDTFEKARSKVIKNIKTLNWENGFYRKDIGYKVIK